MSTSESVSDSTFLVSTRKGLFVVDGAGAAARIAATAFLGDNVALAMTDRRDGAWTGGLDPGHSGAKRPRATTPAPTGPGSAPPPIPPNPEALAKKAWGGRHPRGP